MHKSASSSRLAPCFLLPDDCLKVPLLSRRMFLLLWHVFADVEDFYQQCDPGELDSDTDPLPWFQGYQFVHLFQLSQSFDLPARSTSLCNCHYHHAGDTNVHAKEMMQQNVHRMRCLRMWCFMFAYLGYREGKFVSVWLSWWSVGSKPTGRRGSTGASWTCTWNQLCQRWDVTQGLVVTRRCAQWCLASGSLILLWSPFWQKWKVRHRNLGIYVFHHNFVYPHDCIEG